MEIGSLCQYQVPKTKSAERTICDNNRYLYLINIGLMESKTKTSCVYK
jgi:hypothetical protein